MRRALPLVATLAALVSSGALGCTAIVDLGALQNGEPLDARSATTDVGATDVGAPDVGPADVGAPDVGLDAALVAMPDAVVDLDASAIDAMVPPDAPAFDAYVAMDTAWADDDAWASMDAPTIDAFLRLDAPSPDAARDAHVSVSGFSFDAFVKSSATLTHDGFGVSVALSADGSTLAVGSVDPFSPAARAGRVHVYRRTATDWALEAALDATNPGTSDGFGQAIALSGDGNTLAVGAPWEDGSGRLFPATSDEAAMDSGAVYVFTRTGSMWSTGLYVKASNSTSTDRFGTSLALSHDGRVLAIGAVGADAPAPSAVAGAGAVYVYRRPAADWTFDVIVRASNAQNGDWFGVSVALSGDGSTLAVGAEFEDSSSSGVGGVMDEGGGPVSGAAYVLRHDGSAWTQEAFVKASSPGPNDHFGTALALSPQGDTLVVAATFEDGSGTGVDSMPNESAMWAGAAYLYTRVGSTWSFDTYLKATNTGATDRFGWSVSVGDRGETVLIGAPEEDSAAVGLDGPTFDSGPGTGSGAAYFYERVGGMWARPVYVKASNTGSGDAFGRSVALSADGRTLAIGAHREDSSGTGVGSVPDEAAEYAGAVYVYRRP